MASPLADPAQVIFSVATKYVGPWLADVMSWLVVSSLFAGLLAFQNSGARYFFSLGRADVLPARLGHVSRRGTGVVLVEILVSVAVIAYFRREQEDKRVWNTVIAPALSIVGLALGLYLLMSRFGLLAGTAAKGVDPTTTSWGLSLTGWALVTIPFAVFIIGTVLGSALQRRENVDAVADLVS